MVDVSKCNGVPDYIVASDCYDISNSNKIVTAYLIVTTALIAAAYQAVTCRELTASSPSRSALRNFFC